MPKHRVLITKGGACHHTSPISSVRPARLVGTASAPVASLCTLMPPASCALWASRRGRSRNGLHLGQENLGQDKPGEWIMRTRPIFRTILLLAITGGLSSAHALTQEELVARIQAAGYAQVSDIKSTAEGITAKAVKNGKAVTLVVDSSGQVKERN